MCNYINNHNFREDFYFAVAGFQAPKLSSLGSQVQTGSVASVAICRLYATFMTLFLLLLGCHGLLSSVATYCLPRTMK